MSTFLTSWLLRRNFTQCFVHTVCLYICSYVIMKQSLHCRLDRPCSETLIKKYYNESQWCLQRCCSCAVFTNLFYACYKIVLWDRTRSSDHNISSFLGSLLYIFGNTTTLKPIDLYCLSSKQQLPMKNACYIALWWFILLKWFKLDNKACWCVVHSAMPLRFGCVCSCESLLVEG